MSQETTTSRNQTSERIAILGGLIYLSFAVVAFFPEIFAALSGIGVLEGSQRAHLQSLLTAVAPVGFIYLFAALRHHQSLINLTLAWRLVYVFPWLLITLATGGIEFGTALLIAAGDVGLPVLTLALSRDLSWLKGPYGSWKTLSDVVAGVEGIVGFVATNVFAIFLLVSPELIIDAPVEPYVLSFTVSVMGLYFLYTLWASRTRAPGSYSFGLAMRAVVVGISATWFAWGFPPNLCLGFGITSAIFLAIQGYTRLWEYVVGGGERWSPTRWIVVAAIAVMASSAAWITAIPTFGPTCSVIATSVHRQDLIIGLFALMVGLALLDVQQRAPIHTRVISWMMPVAAVWFTLETKVLCHTGSGSPFHPSWTAKGLAPVWGDSVFIDITFWFATMWLTAVTTTYTALVILRYFRTEGWRRLVWHGTAIVLLSALWIVLTSSGTPGPTQALQPIVALPPMLPGDPITAVGIHIYDMFMGTTLMAVGLLLDHFVPKSARFAKVTFIGAWYLFALPKVLLHLTAGGIL